MKKRDNELIQVAIKNGHHYARSNQPEEECSKINPFTISIKQGYEKSALEIIQKLQIRSQITDARMDLDYYHARFNDLGREAELLTSENTNDLKSVEDFNPSDVSNRLKGIILFSTLLFVGEVIYNSTSMQVIGENLLFSIIISISVTLAILALAHLTAVYCKRLSSKKAKLIACSVSTLIATTVFTGMSFLHTAYLKTQDINVSPVFFVLIMFSSSSWYWSDVLLIPCKRRG